MRGPLRILVGIISHLIIIIKLIISVFVGLSSIYVCCLEPTKLAPPSLFPFMLSFLPPIIMEINMILDFISSFESYLILTGDLRVP